MSKPADDKLAHAKREIKALKLKLESCSRFASQHLGKIERLEALVESCSKRNESDCDLIDSLQEQVSELEASAVVLEGWRVLPEDLATHLWDFKAAVSHMIECNGDPEGYWLHQAKTIENIERLIAAASLSPKQEPAK
jgi:hypothetical protein